MSFFAVCSTHKFYGLYYAALIFLRPGTIPARPQKNCQEDFNASRKVNRRSSGGEKGRVESAGGRQGRGIGGQFPRSVYQRGVRAQGYYDYAPQPERKFKRPATRVFGPKYLSRNTVPKRGGGGRG